MTYMKFQSILFIILVVTLASCQGSKSTPAVQDIDLFVGSKQITNVYVDAVKVELSTSDSYAFPLKLTEGFHIVSWQVGADKKTCSFEVGEGEGSISIKRIAPLVDFDGSVKVAKQPK